MSAHPRVRKASWMSSRISQRTRRRRNQSRWANARSMKQRWLPRPEPCSVPRRAIRGFTPRSQTQAPVLVVVVAAVTQHYVRAASWTASLSAYRRHGLEEWDQLGDVVAVAAGQGDGKRDAGGVGDQVVFAAGSAPVDGASSGGSSARPGLPRARTRGTGGIHVAALGFVARWPACCPRGRSLCTPSHIVSEGGPTGRRAPGGTVGGMRGRLRLMWCRRGGCPHPSQKERSL